MTSDFKCNFKKLTGHTPLSWQTRLFTQLGEAGTFPTLIDLPTGFGKAMVMAIWLIARANNSQLPRRLIYVVDRRTVVDQATDLAIKIRDNAKSKLGLDIAISTLRGQLADNREWSADPTKPAIIIGTVDLIGSALLFSGYRSSYKRRPLEAGLLGMDSLLVLDEAHLSRPFEKLLGSIQRFSSPGAGGSPVKPMQVTRMSATSSGDGEDRFSLGEHDLQDEVVKQRYHAKKTLSINTRGERDRLTAKLADAAIELATQPDIKGRRIVVFVQQPDDARAIADRIRAHQSTKSRSGPFADSVEVLTGTMRGLERDELVEKPVMKRFLDGEKLPDSIDAPVFLVSTSAGEVGFDLNADHMVCDATPIDSFIQRLGRVNRRGHGDARVILIPPENPKEESDFDKARIETTKLLDDGMALSPYDLAKYKDTLTPEQLKAACTPEPATVDLTDILLDNWSMTSIVTPMPGRPEVGPWLRGIAEWEPPQTTIAWRAELDLPGFDQLELDTIEEWFDTHRILTHETLAQRSDDVAEALLMRWKTLEQSLTPAELDRLQKATVVIDRAGLRVMTVKALLDLIQDKDGKPIDDAIRYAQLILPASFGGIERGKGLLDADAPTLPADTDQKPADEQAQARERLMLAPDVADERGRYREVVEIDENRESLTRPLVSANKPSKAARYRVNLESDDETTVKLISYVPQLERPEIDQKPQTLEEHVKQVRKRADDMIHALAMTENDPVRLAL